MDTVMVGTASPFAATLSRLLHFIIHSGEAGAEPLPQRSHARLAKAWASVRVSNATGFATRGYDKILPRARGSEMLQWCGRSPGCH